MKDKNYLELIKEITVRLVEEKIPYHFIDSTSLWLQGVEVDHSESVFVQVQWDLFDNCYQIFQDFEQIGRERNERSALFKVKSADYTILVHCDFNTTIKTDPYRIEIMKENQLFYCISLYKYLYFNSKKINTLEIEAYLSKEQALVTEQNEAAWNQNNYAALLNRYGAPEEIANKIIENPKWRLHPFYKYLDPLANKKVLHLLGSNGIKGVAMSLLGADVTVVDFSKENEMFALELSEAAGTNLSYVVSDVLSLPNEQFHDQFDIVLMELGVLHYFINLNELMQKIYQLLRKNGRFVLHEFHPISTKLITSTGKKHKVTGNYFDPSIEKNHVAFTKHMPEDEKANLQHVLQRKWTLGEIITSAGSSQLVIETLEEEPNHKISDIGLPKTFTLVAKKL
ncbi:class I SAM-dependent methyltransferase [Heyndrickxia sporothermodurans]|nr:class I SAM-dependent methyltransferase [Heyndrickxia sporothermodurans]MEB6547618.1 class I SAM-dependent methyltransferase [Heyndrickxia sporothermodurans]MED3650934.1 class I SAM-dependent methyltransferase [Heyndrickxia sporothermodurans]MED3699240.1 class I SAM-dependent methyltransferase [Heyndrickxia sporothermodurans]MED3780859.1 class I SAM-dependent methyltransferase [Heyndrickxia sporothermodurans]